MCRRNELREALCPFQFIFCDKLLEGTEQRFFVKQQVFFRVPLHDKEAANIDGAR